jgi:probable rRNA maturation factor
MPEITFFAEDIDFELEDQAQIKTWITETIQAEGGELGELNYIFCTDEYLHNINVEYLDHDTYTDIITFDNSEEGGSIEGDIFISIARVRENAAEFTVNFSQELNRVLIHGVLHLLGYMDESDEEELQMRTKEDFYLSKLPS